MRLLHIALLICAAGAAIACSSGGSGGAASTANDGAAAPTFTQVYTDVLGPSCGMVCHNPSGPGVSEGKLDMSTQAAAFMNLNMAAQGTACASSSMKRVTPGDADKSLVYLKVSLDDPTPCGGHMPLQLPNLAQDKTDEIENWINAGAKND
jgi:hypothetical protein